MVKAVIGRMMNSQVSLFSSPAATYTSVPISLEDCGSYHLPPILAPDIGLILKVLLTSLLLFTRSLGITPRSLFVTVFQLFR